MRSFNKNQVNGFTLAEYCDASASAIRCAPDVNGRHRFALNALILYVQLIILHFYQPE
jgi:hypothetical protein